MYLIKIDKEILDRAYYEIDMFEEKTEEEIFYYNPLMGERKLVKKCFNPLEFIKKEKKYLVCPGDEITGLFFENIYNFKKENDNLLNKNKDLLKREEYFLKLDREYIENIQFLKIENTKLKNRIEIYENMTIKDVFKFLLTKINDFIKEKLKGD